MISTLRDRWTLGVMLGFGLWACASIVLLFVYQGSLHGPYIFDDLYTFDDRIREGHFPDVTDWLRPQSRPLLSASFCVTHHLWSSPIVGHRIGNVLIHALNFVLLYFLIAQCRGKKRIHENCESSFEAYRKLHPGRSQSNRWVTSFGIDRLALYAAGLWALHPLCSQCVAYLSQRAESLMATFFLGLLIVLRWRTHHKFVQSMLMVLLFSLGMYTKTVMLSALAVVPLFDRTYMFDNWKDILRNRMFFYSMIVASGLVGVAAFLPDLRVGRSGVGFGSESPSVGIYLLTEIAVVFDYLWLSLWPMQLSIDREPQFFTRLSEVVVQCLAMIFWMAIAAYCWRCKTSTPPSLKPVAFLLLAPLLVLAPSSSFVPTADPMFEHRFYLPLAFVIWLVAELIDRLRQEHYFVFMHSTIFIRAIILVMLIGFATRSYLRANDYATSERIWRSALAIDPGNSRAAQNFVASLLESNQAQATLDVLTAMLIEAELEGKADDALAHQVARERLSRGDSYGAIKILALLTKQARHFDECVTDRQRREYGELWFDLAVAYAQVGRFELAISALKHTLIATPRDPIANQFAGDLYSQAGNNELANKHFRLVEEISKEIQ